MRFESLGIQEFGKRRDLRLEGFSPRLNVVYGPNGSGKSTAIQFIRWMLFGNCDAQCQRYLEATVVHAAGTMSLVHDGLRRTLARQDDGTRYGRLAVDGGEHYTRQTNHMVSLLGDLDQTDFDRLFSLSFEREASLMQLTEMAVRRGFDLNTKVVDAAHLSRLRQRLGELRGQLESLPWTDGLLSDMHRRREELCNRIGSTEERLRQRREELQRELDAMNDNVARAQPEVDGLCEQLSTRDREVDARRHELEQSWRAVDDARSDFVADRESELTEVDRLMDPLQGLLGQMKDRRESLLDLMRDREAASEQAVKDAKDICPIQVVLQQLEAINTQIQKLSERLSPCPSDSSIGQFGENWPADDFGLERATSNWGLEQKLAGQDLQVELTQLRAEAKRLCKLVQNSRVAQQYHELQQEEQQVQNCELHLRPWMEMLENRRKSLTTELTHVDHHGVDVVRVHSQIHADYLRWPAAELLTRSQVVGTVHTCDRVEAISPESDVRLRHLVEQRDLLAREYDEARRRLDSLVARRAEVETSIRGRQEDDLSGLRSELDRLDVDIRYLEQRDCFQREIALLEHEIAQLEADVQPSPIVAQASRYLTKLTHGTYGEISIHPGHEIWVQQTGGERISHDHLSRGVRDQLYLSMCLALIEACGRRDVEIPLVLNDVFINIDSERDDAMADAISDFAQLGHQVVIFTRHRHVADLFSGKETRYLELVRRLVPVRETTDNAETMAPVAETDHVRFRHHDAEDLDMETTADLVIVRREPRASTEIAVTPGTDVDSEMIDGTQGSIELELESLIQSTGVINSDVASRLQGMGILTVEDFLLESAGAMESELERWGLAGLPLRRWQDETSLRCWTSGLSEEEARVLVACGITDISQLAEMDEDDLFGRVSRFLSSQGNDHQYRSGRYQYNRNRVGGWVQSARQSRAGWSRYLTRFGRGRTRRSPATDRHNVGAEVSFESRTGQPTQRSNRSSEPGTSRSRKPRESRLSSESRRAPAHRESHPSVRSSAAKRSKSKRDDSLRFYLNASDAVDNAPSIGPKIAERLAVANIRTVADLLEALPATVAKLVAHSRVTEETIIAWKRQATLACRIPQLRGHDAQILVACGVNDPDELVATNVDALWQIVEPFIETNEGKRIIRNGRAPDRDEVADWIRWAQSARSVKAA